MRISTAAMFDQGLAGISSRQTDLARIQQQLTSGYRFSRAADDPPAAASVVLLESLKSQYEAYERSGENVKSRLQIEDSTLGSVSDRLMRVRELVLQSNVPFLAQEDRNGIIQELVQIREQIAGLANTQDGSQRYLFGGSQDADPPFSISSAGVPTYSGDEVQRRIDISTEVSVADADAGSNVFMRIRNGNGTFVTSADVTNTGTGTLSTATMVDSALWDNGSYRIDFTGTTYTVRDAGGATVTTGTYASGAPINFRGVSVAIQGAPATGDVFRVGPSANTDVFSVINSAITAIQAPAGNPVQRASQQNAYFNAIQSIIAAQDHVTDKRGGVGTRLSHVDAVAEEREGLVIEATSSLSNLRDLDYAEASTKLSLTMTALEAAQATFVRVNQLSLFNRLG